MRLLQKQLRFSRIVNGLVLLILAAVLACGAYAVWKIVPLVQDVVAQMNRIDLDGINEAIENLNNTLRPLAEFFNR